MERPAKRIKLTNLIPRALHNAASRLTEGLFTSELGMRSDDTDADLKAMETSTRTRELRRRAGYGEAQRYPRPQIPPRAIQPQPRAPDTTVTASVVDIVIADGSSTSHSVVPVTAEVNLVSANALVASVTPPASTSVSSTADSAGILSSLIASLSADTSSTLTSIAAPPLSTSVTSVNLNGTSLLTTSSASHTITVTHTSTLDLSMTNGTLIYASPTSVETSVSTDAHGSLHTYTNLPSATTTLASTSSSDTSSYIGPLFGQSVTFGTTTSTVETGSTGPSATAGIHGSNGGGSGPAATSTSSGNSQPSQTHSTSGSGSAPLTPQQQQAVGGAVGGVAGVALILCLVLFFLRWYRHRLKSSGRLPEQLTDAGRSRGLGNGGMSQRSSGIPFIAALTGGIRRLRPHSSYIQTSSLTGSTAPDSERGFQRVAGRQIPSVLNNGGDGFGDSYGAFEKGTAPSRTDSPLLIEQDLADKSFYRDKDGLYTSDEANRYAPASPLLRRTQERDFASGSSYSHPSLAHRVSEISLARASRPEGYAVIRPSPARTPVTASPTSSSFALPIQQATGVEQDKNAPAVPTVPPSFGLQVPKMRDGVGRSLASRDGSRVSSRSARFVENLG